MPANDVGAAGRAQKNSVIKYLAVQRAHMIIMRYVNRQGGFCAQPSRLALLDCFIDRLQRGNLDRRRHIFEFLMVHQIWE
jgi:hypothetical protein